MKFKISQKKAVKRGGYGLRRNLVARLTALVMVMVASSLTAGEAEVNQLSQEIAKKGWILFSAKTPAGDYDLFLSRPNGESLKNLTQTPGQNEFGGRFSPDGKKMLYRRTGKEVAINHDLWGAMGVLVVANADGSNPQPQGKEGDLPWACWSPDGAQWACLYKRQGKIRIIDAQSLKIIKEIPRRGVFQQMFWSPDGRRLCGTANLNGQDWNILSIDVDSGKTTLLSRALNCTPDWFQKDAQRVIYSNRTPGLADNYGWTMLMQASADGQSRTLIYGERGKHIYYGCTSPDDQYVIFSFPESDGGTDSNMAIVRLADAPIIVPDDYKELKALYPNARSGPVLRLKQAGFEPHWTYAEIGEK